MSTTSLQGDNALLPALKVMLQDLGAGWHDYLMRTQQLDIFAPDLAQELSRERPVKRNLPGFTDFMSSVARAVEPGDPARSLLYHALASPDVIVTDEHGSPLPDSAYPTWAQLDLLENYIYSLAPFQEADLNGAVIAVFAYEYRPKEATTHRKHADMVYSRTGIARVGTSEVVYKGSERAYTPVTGMPGKIAVLPARYGVFLAKPIKGITNVSILGENQDGDDSRTFLLPFRKLFSGRECIPGRTLATYFAEQHRSEKLRKIIVRVQEEDPRCLPAELNLNAPPFIRQSPDPELVRMTYVGSTVMISAPPLPLIRRAEQDVNGKKVPARFRVPAETWEGKTARWAKPVQGAGYYRHYTALQLPISVPYAVKEAATGSSSQARFARNYPLFVHIRQEVQPDGTIVDLNTLPDKQFDEKITAGGYMAAMFEDGTSDGCVAAFVDGLGKNLDMYPAFSVVAALSFFPRALELDLEKWTEENPNMFHQGDSHPLAEGRFSGNRNVEVPNRDGRATSVKAFGKNDHTTTAVVGRPHGTRSEAPSDLRRVFRTSFLSDAASNVFFPGWDVTIANRDGGFFDDSYFYVTYGLGSPFAEDVKFCAAANGFWPTASPDAGRTFHRADSPTSILLLDNELGYHPQNPAGKGMDVPGWDGGYGPFFQLDRHDNPGVNFANLNRVDYVRDALAGKFGAVQLCDLSSAVLIERMACHRQCIQELQQQYYKYKRSMGIVSDTSLWLINAEQITDWTKIGETELKDPGYRLVYTISQGDPTNLPDQKYTRRFQPIQNLVYVCHVTPGGELRQWKRDAVSWTKEQIAASRS